MNSNFSTGNEADAQTELGPNLLVRFEDEENRRTDVSSPGLESLCRLAKSGLLTPDQFWPAFDECLVFMQRPEYFGVPFCKTEDGRIAAPLFSSVARVITFSGPTSWVSMFGRELWGLDIPPIVMVIDPDLPHSLIAEARTHPRADELLARHPIESAITPEGSRK